MSSAVVSTSAALGRPFVFDPKADSDVCLPSDIHYAEDKYSPFARVQSALKNQSKIPPARVTPASQLDIRPAPEMVSSGVPAIDTLTGGLPRGCLTEIYGPASSGRTTLLLAALAAATRRGEFCVVVDASDTLDPQSAAAAGVELDHLLWVRCSESSPQKERSPQRHPSTPLRAGSATEKNPLKDQIQSHEKNPSEHRLEQVLRATDLLLESGGFGLIVLDLGDLPPQSARRIPLTTWFRFRRAVEYTPTILLVIEQHPIAGSCSSLLLQLGPPNSPRETMMLDPSDSSREAAAFISPGRMSGVRQEIRNESRRDGTEPDAASPIFYPSHAHLLAGLDITAELIRSRLDRKPARSVAFATKTAWAG